MDLAMLPLVLACLSDFNKPPNMFMDQNVGMSWRPQQLFQPRFGGPGFCQLLGRDQPRADMLSTLFGTVNPRCKAEILRQQLMKTSDGNSAARGSSINPTSSSSSKSSSVILDKDTFRVTLDVHQFKPEDIEVKVVDKNIVVEAKHGERKDEHGLVSRQFTRKCAIPETVEAELITSSFSSDGVLTVQAPLKKLPENKNERKIKIQVTGKPAPKLVTEGKEDEMKTEVKKEEPARMTTTTTPDTATDAIPVASVPPEINTKVEF